MRRTVFLLVLLAASALAQGPPPPAPPPTPPESASAPVATDTLQAPPPPEQILAAYRADPDFQYDRPQAEGPSLWDRFWMWVHRTFLDPLYANTTPQLRDWVLVIGSVLAFGWVVSRLLRAEGSGVFARRSGPRAAGPLLDVEDIESVDLRGLLTDALGRGAYREAVRFRYLVLLQSMAEAGAVAWRRDKTNRAYVAEARTWSPALGGPFGEATRVFDYVWYGERPVDRARYEALTPMFDQAEAALDAARQPTAA